jgi:heme A synthase
MFTLVAYAKTLDEAIFSVNKTIINPLIQFAFVIAFVVLLWGVFGLIRNADNPEKRKESQNYVIFGIIGLVIMLGVYAILTILTRTFGINATINNKEQKMTPPEIKELNIKGFQ